MTYQAETFTTFVMLFLTQKNPADLMDLIGGDPETQKGALVTAAVEELMGKGLIHVDLETGSVSLSRVGLRITKPWVRRIKLIEKAELN
jgi:hypothetical protein